MNLLHQLTQKIIAFDHGDPKRIQHFIKVHSFAKLIGVFFVQRQERKYAGRCLGVCDGFGI